VEETPGCFPTRCLLGKRRQFSLPAPWNKRLLREFVFRLFIATVFFKTKKTPGGRVPLPTPVGAWRRRVAFAGNPGSAPLAVCSRCLLPGGYIFLQGPPIRICALNSGSWSSISQTIGLLEIKYTVIGDKQEKTYTYCKWLRYSRSQE